MGRAHRRVISLLLLAIFSWVSFAAHAFSPKWLSHEMDHERGAIVALADQGRDHEEPASEPLSDAEHSLLHALGYLDPAPHSLSIGLGERLAGTILSAPGFPAPPSAELDSPFRPPRGTPRL